MRYTPGDSSNWECPPTRERYRDDEFDNAAIADRLPGTGRACGGGGTEPRQRSIWVCGSTGPGEEAIVVEIYRELLKKFANLRLVIVPRKPERFDEAAEIISKEGFPVVRRSRPDHPVSAAIILGDTIGELRKFYAMADVVFVGRTLVDLGHRQHGSDMIEPAACSPSRWLSARSPRISPKR